MSCETGGERSERAHLVTTIRGAPGRSLNADALVEGTDAVGEGGPEAKKPCCEVEAKARGGERTEEGMIAAFEARTDELKGSRADLTSVETSWKLRRADDERCLSLGGE